MTTAAWGPWAVGAPAERAGLSALRQVAARLGVAAEARAVGGVTGGWTAWLEAAAGRQGLRVAFVELTVEEAAEMAERHGPVLTFVAGRWVLVVGGSSGGVRLAAGDDFDAERVEAAGALASSLGVGEGGAAGLSWAVVEPALPLEGLRSDGDGPLPPHGRLLRMLAEEGGDLQAVVVYALMTGALSLAVPIAAQALVNSIAFGVALQPLVVLTAVVLVALLFEGALRVLQAHVVEGIQQRLFVKVAVDVAERLSRLRADVLRRSYAPELANRFFDVITVQKAAAALLLDGIGLVLQATLGMVLLAFYHPLLLAFDLMLVALLGLLVFVVGRGAVETAVKESKEKYRVASWLEEIGRHSPVFRSAAARGFALERADELVRGYLHYRRKHWGIFLRQVVGIRLLYAVSSAALLGVGGWLVIARQLTLGQLVAAELIVTAVLSGLIKFGKHLESYYDLAAAADKLGQLVDLPLEPSLPRATTMPDSRTAAGVELRAVGLGEGAAVGKLSARIAPGSSVALVGGDAAAKGALLGALYGLERLAEGTLLVDGVDVRQLDPTGYRSQVALVREGQVFEGTIEENLCVGEPTQAARLHQALSAVGLLDDVLGLPEGLQTRLLASGAPLADSQRRRLVLARALLLRPRLLLLDHALDGLDERSAGAALDALLADDAQTLLVATQRDEIARRCSLQLVVGGAAAAEVAS